MTDAICKGTGLRKRFGTTEALRGIDIELATPGVHAILGPSGSGKTTLLNVLAGIELPDGGSTELCGQRIDTMPARGRIEHRGRYVGFVFQRFNLIPSLTARENVELPSRSRGLRPDAAWLKELALAVDVEDMLERYPSEMSGGQQQRVGIVRALLHRPKVMFADEPTGNLDRDSGRTISQLLHWLGSEHGLVVLLVTHDLTLSGGCASVTEVRDGKVVSVPTLS